MNFKEFFINFGNKLLYYFFVADFLVASWIWINTYGTLNLSIKIRIFITMLPIVFLPSLAKMVLKDAQKREEIMRLFDVLYGVFIWILSLILGFTQFNAIYLMVIIIILLVIYNVISVISWIKYPRLIRRLLIPFVIINALIVYYLIRFYSEGIEYYETASILEFIAGIIILAIVASLFIYNELTEILYIFRL